MKYCIKCLNGILSEVCAYKELIDSGEVVLENHCPMFLGITGIPDGVKLECMDSNGDVFRIVTTEGDGGKL